MRSRVCQRKRRAPRSTYNAPTRDAQLRTYRFEIADQALRVVMAKASTRRRCTCASLVHHHDANAREIEQTQRARLTAASRPAMQRDDRHAVWIAMHGIGDCVTIASDRSMHRVV
jgi:hypothetical protein